MLQTRVGVVNAFRDHRDDINHPATSHIKLSSVRSSLTTLFMLSRVNSSGLSRLLFSMSLGRCARGRK